LTVGLSPLFLGGEKKPPLKDRSSLPLRSEGCRHSPLPFSRLDFFFSSWRVKSSPLPFIVRRFGPSKRWDFFSLLFLFSAEGGSVREGLLCWRRRGVPLVGLEDKKPRREACPQGKLSWDTAHYPPPPLEGRRQQLGNFSLPLVLAAAIGVSPPPV